MCACAHLCVCVQSLRGLLEKVPGLIVDPRVSKVLGNAGIRLSGHVTYSSRDCVTPQQETVTHTVLNKTHLHCNNVSLHQSHVGGLFFITSCFLLCLLAALRLTDCFTFVCVCVVIISKWGWRRSAASSRSIQRSILAMEGVI